LDLARVVVNSDYSVAKETWVNPLGGLGQRILAREVNQSVSPQMFERFAERGLHDGNHIVSSDIIASSFHRGLSERDFGGLTLVSGHITELDLSVTEPKRLAIVDSIIEKLIFPNRPITGIKIEKCIIGQVYGVSDQKGIPAWVVDTDVSHYDSVVNVSSIKNVRLSIQHRILVTILKKTFFQKGAARQEAALLRGLGQIDQGGQAAKILGYLVTNDILEKAKGDHGPIYVPVLKHKRRVGTILSELNMSTDEIWSWVGAL
jgi:hypothetical protein